MIKKKRKNTSKERDRETASETREQHQERKTRGIETLISENEFERLYFRENKSLTAIASAKRISSVALLWKWAAPRFNLRGPSIPLTDQNRLSLRFPEVAKEWHPTKNGNLTPDDVSFGSKKKIWWQCPLCNDERKASIWSRTYAKNLVCPACAVHNGGFIGLPYWKPWQDLQHRERESFKNYLPQICS